MYMQNSHNMVWQVPTTHQYVGIAPSDPAKMTPLELPRKLEIKELRQHHSNFWENCEKTKFLQCLECLINFTATAAFKKSTALCHYGSFEVNLAAPPLKVPVLALASGENTKPEVRLELMGYPGVSRGKSWIEQPGTSGNNGTLKC